MRAVVKELASAESAHLLQVWKAGIGLLSALALAGKATVSLDRGGRLHYTKKAEYIYKGGFPVRVMLTSCGLETDKLKQCFLDMLGKNISQVKALFIPTAAIDADAIAVLPKCMNDLLKCGIPSANISVFDLHENMPLEELTQYDVVYLCGGRTAYLLGRMNQTGFAGTLLSYIRGGGLVLGVSAGSIIFAGNLPGNLGLVDAPLDVHCAEGNLPGKVSFPHKERIRLTNTGAMILRSIPEDVEIIDG